jgi:hypothetical protein
MWAPRSDAWPQSLAARMRHSVASESATEAGLDANKD